MFSHGDGKLSQKERQKLTSKAWLERILKDDPRPFKCKECPKKYANNGTLYRHKFVHSQVKNFKCDVCGNAFRDDIKLRAHKISHLEKTLKCESCPLLFKGESHLKVHRKVHLGTKEYQCELCPQKFTQMGSMKRHMLIQDFLFPEL